MDPPFAVPVAVATAVVDAAAEKESQHQSLLDETEAHNEIMRAEAESRNAMLREEKERMIQEARMGFLAELEPRVKHYHAQELQRTREARIPFESFFVFYMDLCERFPALDLEAVVDIFASCQAANGFDVRTTIVMDKGTGGTFGDHGAKFQWKGRNWKARVCYWRGGKEHWLCHM